MVLAVRQIPVQYARRSVAGSGPSGIYSKRQYIPLRLNASGVMPIIFAQAIMFAPAYLGQMIGGSFGQWMNTAFSNMFGLSYNILFGLLIILFTYFYTAITVPTNKMADDLKRSGGFIPGIKPGGETADFLDKIMSFNYLSRIIILSCNICITSGNCCSNEYPARMSIILWWYFAINYGWSSY